MALLAQYRVEEELWGYKAVSTLCDVVAGEKMLSLRFCGQGAGMGWKYPNGLVGMFWENRWERM